MAIDITLLSPHEENEYDAVLKADGHALVYQSIKYRDLLRKVTGGEDYYLVAKQMGQIVGMMPAFLMRNSEYGNVLNSLPFFGSNGGAINSPYISNGRDTKRELIGAFHELAREKEAILSTVITNPFDKDQDLYEKNYDYQDSRIGQITRLPNISKNDVEVVLTQMLHSKTRNAIRKAIKENIQSRVLHDIDDLSFLANVHKLNIESIGGMAKEWTFFSSLYETFEYDKDYRVYIAELEGKPIGALLVIYYHLVVEYYTPAIVEEYRSLQPLSLLIFQAIKDSIERGYLYWNWGGTWRTQKGVYDFKKRWGTMDLPYFYYIKAYGDICHIKALGRDGIIEQYPFFYVIPFGVIHDGKE